MPPEAHSVVHPKDLQKRHFLTPKMSYSRYSNFDLCRGPWDRNVIPRYSCLPPLTFFRKFWPWSCGNLNGWSRTPWRSDSQGASLGRRFGHSHVLGSARSGGFVLLVVWFRRARCAVPQGALTAHYCILNVPVCSFLPTGQPHTPCIACVFQRFFWMEHDNPTIS